MVLRMASPPFLMGASGVDPFALLFAYHATPQHTTSSVVPRCDSFSFTRTVVYSNTPYSGCQSQLFTPVSV